MWLLLRRLHVTTRNVFHCLLSGNPFTHGTYYGRCVSEKRIIYVGYIVIVKKYLFKLVDITEIKHSAVDSLNISIKFTHLFTLYIFIFEDLLSAIT